MDTSSLPGKILLPFARNCLRGFGGCRFLCLLRRRWCFRRPCCRRLCSNSEVTVYGIGIYVHCEGNLRDALTSLFEGAGQCCTGELNGVMARLN